MSDNPTSTEEKIKAWLEKNKITKVKTSISGSPQKQDESRAQAYLKKRRKK